MNGPDPLMLHADTQPYLGVRDCAILLGVSREIIYRLVDTGDLQAIRTPGGHRRILRRSVDELRLKQGTGAALRDNIPDLRRAKGEDASGAPMSLLLVDDELVSLTWLKHLVSHELPQVTIQTARDADMAFATMEQTGCPDVVITDLNMPGDGFKLVWALHERPDYQRALVIATTALDGSEIRAAGGLPERVIQLAKPVQPDAVLKLLQAALLLRPHLKARAH